MIVVLSFLILIIQLFFLAVFFGRRQVAASVITYLTSVIAAFGIFVTFLFLFYGFSDKAIIHNFIGSVFEGKPSCISEYEICTRNQENEAREDKTSEWDCVTEGNRKICIKHGAAKWD